MENGWLCVALWTVVVLGVAGAGLWTTLKFVIFGDRPKKIVERRGFEVKLNTDQIPVSKEETKNHG
jgi:hypothetical protein